MTNTNATYATSIAVDLPDYPAATVTFTNTAFFVSGNSEVLPGKQYSLTLDGSGQGTQTLPCPDNTGDLAINWRINLPSKESGTYAIAYDAATQQLATILAAQSTTTNPDVITALLANVPTADDAAWVSAAATAVPDGADVASTDDLATTQAAAIAALGGADSTVTDEQLRNWAGQLPELMTSVTRTDYSATKTLYSGTAKYAGSIHVTGTVTWPDGVTGHLDGVEYPEQPGVLQYFTASHVTSGKIVIQSPLVDGAAGLTVVTPDYYVDSAAAAGGDGSLATPFDTLSDLSLSSGDIVALKSASHWREQLTIGVDNVAIYRYGAGARPKLDASEIITGTWTNDGTYTNLWYIDVTPTDANPGSTQTNLYIDDAVPTSYQLSLANCNSNADSFHVPDQTAATQRIYYHPASSNPNDDGRVYEYTDRAHTIDATERDNLIIDGIVCTRNRDGGGTLRLGRSVILRHVDALDGHKHNAYFEDGAALYGCRFVGAQLTSANPTGTLSVYNENTPAGLGITIADCVYDTGATTTTIAGGHGHYNVSGDFGAVVYDRCYMTNVSFGISSGSGAYATIDIRRCVLGNAARIADLSSVNTGDQLIEDNICIGPCGTFFYTSATAKIVLRNNYALLSGLNGGIRFAGTGTWYIYGNEWENDGTVASVTSRVVYRWDSGALPTCRIWDNRVLGTKDAGATYDFGIYYYVLGATNPRLYLDRNHWGNATMNSVFPQNSFNADTSTMPGTALTNVSSIAGTAGDASQEAQGLFFA